MNDKTGVKRLFAARFRIGMRVIKTIVAVFICCVLDYLRGTVPIQSTMAALICIQPDTENTINTAVSRVLATLLGSGSAILLLIVFSKTGIMIHSIPFYLILSLFLIPLITITVKMGWPSATAVTCIIFLAIALGYTEEGNLFAVALDRMIGTLIGILVAVPVNMLLPNHSVPAVDGPIADESVPDETVPDEPSSAEPDKPDK